MIERKPQFPKEIFSKEAILLLTGLLQKRPENRMGCGERGIEEIKVRTKKRAHMRAWPNAPVGGRVCGCGCTRR